MTHRQKTNKQKTRKQNKKTKTKQNNKKPSSHLSTAKLLYFQNFPVGRTWSHPGLGSTVNNSMPCSELSATIVKLVWHTLLVGIP